MGDWITKSLVVTVVQIIVFLTFLFYGLVGTHSEYSTPVIVTIQTFLFVGLFIAAHDAMHGLVLPRHTRINWVVGQICVFLYAGFSYRFLNKKHHEHHRYSGTNKDPDFLDSHPQSFARWYLKFMMTYLTWQQLFWLVVFVQTLKWVGLSMASILIFWALPAILSTFQLIYFGTYLPHRRLAGRPFSDRHNARDNEYPAWLSFITCYHFGYHLIHHRKPHLRWFELPTEKI